jgi:hypothetical protein
MFRREGVPVKFAMMFQDALQLSLSGKPNPENLDTTFPKSLATSQSKIGWSKMLRGFLSQQWMAYLRRTIMAQRAEQWLYQNEHQLDSRENDTQWNTRPSQDAQMSNSSDLDPPKLIAKIITIMWQAQFQLWTAHTQHIHETGTKSEQSQREELQAEIRTMHNSRNQVLAEHRDQYFFQDVDQYSETATITQMRRYVMRYKPVILNSVKQATKTATQTLRIPQFFNIRNRPHVPRPHITLNGNEEPQHRKHTKIRNMLVQKISGFFPPKQKPA